MAQQSSPVVVGVDDSAAAVTAVRWAARDAARRTRPLVIVHACPVLPTPPHARTYFNAYRTSLEQTGRRLLRAAEAAARVAAPTVRMQTVLVHGNAAGELRAWSLSADMVVIGSRGLGGIAGLVVGSVAISLTAHAHCPVVVVRPPGRGESPGDDAPVVVGVDGSAENAYAVRFAFDAAAAREVPLVAVHTWLDTAGGGLGEVDWSEDWATTSRRQMGLLRDWLSAARGEHSGVAVDHVVTRDDPVHSLLERSRAAQLLVVGTRGRGGFGGLLLGSTSQALIRRAPCPVAVVPHRPSSDDSSDVTSDVSAGDVGAGDVGAGDVGAGAQAVVS